MSEAVRRGGKKNRKWGRNRRKPGGALQARRTHNNKLRRVNRDRAKSGKPPLPALPSSSRAYTLAFKRMP